METKEQPKNIILTRKEASYNSLTQKREYWEEYEKLFHNELNDTQSQSTKSQVFDPKLSTMVLEREARVMAQLPTGKVKAISKNDKFGEKLMNLVLDKYVNVNANDKYPLLTKYRMVDRYSNIYGAYPVFVDWRIDEGGYVGPDMYLLNIRDVFPQPGASSIQDSDYIIIRTWQPISYFEGLLKNKEFKNIKEVVEKLKNKAVQKSDEDKDARESKDYPSTQVAKNTGFFEVLSMYERDKWTDYVTDADLVIREMKNPHDNGELPVVMKYSIPLLSDFWGMGDFERGKSMQYTLNSLWNLYLDGVKVSIFPPTLINKDYIADLSSIKWSAAAKWLVKGPNGTSQAAQAMNLSPSGQQTFNNVYQIVTSSLLNMMGTTDTAVSAQTDPGFGKTPEALKQQSARESARDNVDRFYMEQFLKEVNKKFVNLISKKMSNSVQFRMFSDEIEELATQYPEISDIYDDKTGKLTVNKKSIGSVLYDYEIISGSTYALDQQEQQQNLLNMLNMFTQAPAIVEALKAEGKEVKIGELMTRILVNSGIQDYEKIIEEVANNPDRLMQDQMNKFMSVMNGTNVNAIPAQGMPQGQPQQPMPQGGQL
ncbi:MAG: hypothetical protein BWY21_01772 [Parcubacteria group bacterium ADurb.Bin216]|nr:MAG: hypothetical protein BWY21_01772 [Parcubacteria group bacterium ADurb.Bin216]